MWLSTPPESLDVGLPVVFQKQTAVISSIENDHVVFDRLLVLRDANDLCLRQTQVICAQHDMQPCARDEWRKMWRRDADDDEIANWPDVPSKLACLQDCPSMECAPLTVTEWKLHAKSVKRRSARGSCAYTAKELLMLPDELTEWLLVVLREIGTGDMQWPPSLMTSRVVLLGKTDEPPTSPLQIRPITIASRIYRNWSRYRSMQIVKHLQQMLLLELAQTCLLQPSYVMLRRHIDMTNPFWGPQ